MRRTIGGLLMTALLWAPSPRVLAADLVTAGAYVGSAHTASCKLVNISPKPITARVQEVSISFGVVEDTGAMIVPPGALLSVFTTPNDTVYCRFVGVSKAKTRCDLTIAGNVSSDSTEATIVPAQ